MKCIITSFVAYSHTVVCLTLILGFQYYNVCGIQVAYLVAVCPEIIVKSNDSVTVISMTITDSVAVVVGLLLPFYAVIFITCHSHFLKSCK